MQEKHMQRRLRSKECSWTEHLLINCWILHPRIKKNIFRIQIFYLESTIELSKYMQEKRFEEFDAFDMDGNDANCLSLNHIHKFWAQSWLDNSHARSL